MSSKGSGLVSDCFLLVPLYLLFGEDDVELRHLAVFVGAENFAEGTGGHAAAQAIDVDLLLLVMLAHGMLLRHGRK